MLTASGRVTNSGIPYKFWLLFFISNSEGIGELLFQKKTFSDAAIPITTLILADVQLDGCVFMLHNCFIQFFSC